MNLRGIIVHIAVLIFSYQPIVLSSSIEFEVEILFKTLEELIDQGRENDLYSNKRRKICTDLRTKLISTTKEADYTSRLFSFPDLDIESYNDAIKALHKKYAQLKKLNEPKLFILLHLWSLLTNIKVIGLKNSGEYYEKNTHFKKYCTQGINEDFSFQFDGSKTIYLTAIPPQNRELGSVSTPINLIESALHFRLQDKSRSIGPIQEVQQITWELLRDETVSLGSFTRCSGDKTSLIEDFLEVVLRLRGKNNSPCYSLGLISLFRNIAVYFSLVAEHATIVDSPCSRETTEFFGFQDGFFLPKGTQLKRIIDNRFGLMLFRRGLSKNLLEDNSRASKIFRDKVADYFPHYPVDGSYKVVALAMTGNSFAGQFSTYMQAPEPKQNDLFANIIRIFDNQQFKAPLISKEELTKELGDVLIEPGSTVALSGTEARSKFGHEISDRESLLSDDDEIEPITSNIIRHFVCWPYQNIIDIDFSGNQITDKGAKKLLSLLDKNFLPLLKRINLSNNSITELTWEDLKNLLSRYYFSYFVFRGSVLKGNCGLLPIDQVKKVIPDKAAGIPQEFINHPAKDTIKEYRTQYYEQYPTL